MAMQSGTRQFRLERIVSEHTKGMMESVPFQEIMHDLARGIAHLTGDPETLVRIWLQDAPNHPGPENYFGGPWTESMVSEVDHLLVRAIDTDNVLRLDNLQLHQSHHLQSVLVIPLLYGNICPGAIFVGSEKPRQFTTSVLPWINILAHQITQAVLWEQSRFQITLANATDRTPATSAGIFNEFQRLAEKCAKALAEEREKQRARTREDARKKGKDTDRGKSQEQKTTRIVVEILGLTSDSDALVTLGAASPTVHVLPGYYARNTVAAWQAIVKDNTYYIKNHQPGHPMTNIMGSTCALALPIRDGRGRPIGVVSVETSQPNTLTEDDPIVAECRASAEACLRDITTSAWASATSFSAFGARFETQFPNVLDSRRLSALYKLLLRRIIQVIGQPDARAAIAFCGDGVFTITMDAAYNYAPEMIQVWSWPEGKGFTGWARRDRKSKCIADVHDKKYRDIYFEQDPTIQSELVVPLLLGKQVLGVIDMVSTEPNAFTDRDQQRVEELARCAARTLEHAKVIRGGWLAQTNLQQLREINDDVASMLRLDRSGQDQDNQNLSLIRHRRRELLQKLVKVATEYTNSSKGVILAAVRLPDGSAEVPQKESVELVELATFSKASSSSSDSVIQIPVDRAPSNIAARAFSAGEVRQYFATSVAPMERVAELSSDGIELEQIVAEAPMLGAAMRSALVVPIPGGDRITGVICLESDVRRMYSPAQIKRVEINASQAASIISAANLYLYRRKLRTILKLIDRVMTGSLTEIKERIHPEIRDDIMRLTLDLTEQTDGYASLWFVDNRGNLQPDCSFIGVEGKPTPMPHDETLQIKPGIVNRVLESQAPLVVLDVDDPAFAPIFTRTFRYTKSELAVPLLNPDVAPGDPQRVMGVLNVESRSKAAFSGRDINILEILAQIMVTSIRLGGMYNEKLKFIEDFSHGPPSIASQVDAILMELEDGGIRDILLKARQADYSKSFSSLTSAFALLRTFIYCIQELAEYETRGREIRSVPVNLGELLTRLVASTEFLASDTERTISFQTSDRDVVVECSSDLITVAIFALLHNAIKHAERYTTIAVRVTMTGRGRGRVEVENRGAPITRDVRQTMFERHFTQARSVDNGMGVGIGLDHVRRIVESAHGGQAGYKRRGGANVFYIDLPVKHNPHRPPVSR